LVVRSAALFKFVSRFRAARGGNVLITAALAFPVLLGSVGLGTEVASWYGGKRSLQNVADSAAIAAATNGDPASFADEAKAVAAQYGVLDGVKGVKVTATAGVPCPGLEDEDNCYRVVVSRPQPLLLAQMVGYAGDAALDGQPAKLITAIAVARQADGREYCLLALAGSGHQQGIRSNGAPKADMSGCAVMSNTSAVCNGHDLDADYGDAHGVNDGCGNRRRSEVPVVADPYAGLASNIPSVYCPNGFPVAPEKNKEQDLPLSNQLSGSVLWSGDQRYCGDVQLQGNLTVSTGQDGAVLVIRDGKLDLNGYTIKTSDGSGLTIVFTGSDGARTHTPSGSGAIDVAAPRKGAWSGVAMYQDPAIPAGAASTDIDYAGNEPTWDITGLVYLPKASVTFSGAVNKSSNGHSCFAMVVDNIRINGTGSILAGGTECSKAGLKRPTGTGGRGRLVS
jgi:hypothetical protein